MTKNNLILFQTCDQESANLINLNILKKNEINKFLVDYFFSKYLSPKFLMFAINEEGLFGMYIRHFT